MTAPAIDSGSKIESDYTAALREARATGYRLGAEGIARLRRMFGTAIQDLTRQLATVGDNEVTKERATVLREQIELTLGLIERRIAELTQESAQATAEAVVAIHAEVNADLARTYRNDLVPEITKAFDVIQARAVTTFAARSRNASTYKTLAKRNVADAAPALDNMLGSAIARGVSSGRLTKDVAALLAGGSPDLKTYGLDPSDVSGLKTLLYDARRIAITETNNALREGNRLGLLASPIIKAVKWQVSGRHEAIPGLAPDECDDLANGNDAEDLAELGPLPPGYYSPKRFPLAPHPFCACVQGGPTLFYPPSEWGKRLGKTAPEPDPIDELADKNLTEILKEKVREETPEFRPSSPNKIVTLTVNELKLDRDRVTRLLERARREIAIEDRDAIIARAKDLLAKTGGKPRVELLVEEFGILQEDASRLLAEAENELKLARVTDQELFEAAKQRLEVNGRLKGDAVVYLVTTFKVPGERAVAAVDRALNALAGVSDETLVQTAIGEFALNRAPSDIVQTLMSRYQVSFERAFNAVEEAQRRIGPAKLTPQQEAEARAEIEAELRRGISATDIIRSLDQRFDTVSHEVIADLVLEVQRKVADAISDTEVEALARTLIAQGKRAQDVVVALASSVLAGDVARARRIVEAIKKAEAAAQAAGTASGRQEAALARGRLAEIARQSDAEAEALRAERVALLQEVNRLDLVIAEAQAAARAATAAGGPVVDLNLLPEVVAAGEKVDAIMKRATEVEALQKTALARRREAAYSIVGVTPDPKRQGTFVFASKIDAKRREVWERGIDVLRRLVPPEVLDGFTTELHANRGSRAFYRSGDGAYLSKGDHFTVVVHELGHAIEYYRPEILRQSIAWRDGRTVGEALQQLQKLQPGYGYRRDEITRPDKFFSPYVGKDYGQRASEVLSMGLEEMARDPIGFAEKDPDMFDFIFAVLRSAMNPNPTKRGVVP